MNGVRWVLVALGLVGCGGKYVPDSSTSQAPGAGASSACLNSGEAVPASALTFSFESNQALWLHDICDIEYTLNKICSDTTVPIATESVCSQECVSKNYGCPACGACPEADKQVGPFRPDGSNVTTAWDGYVYAGGTSASGCACHERIPARSGTYAITVTAFNTSDNVYSRAYGHLFTTTFEYPPLDGMVHVPLNVTAP